MAAGLRRPETLAVRGAWDGLDPYSTQFAVSTIKPLLQSHNLTSSCEVYFVGHSAGSPVALQSYIRAASTRDFLPDGVKLGGCVLAAPAVLELDEDPDAYDFSEDEGAQIPYPLRLAAFRTLLALPDAFSIKLARRLVDRDLREALLSQTHPRMAGEDMRERVKELADKYFAPTREFPEAWDLALLAVYRADVGVKDVLRGRSLLAKAKRMVGSKNGLGVISGDSDGVVPLRASTRVAEILEVPLKTISECGHLPMDEKPEDFASELTKFINDKI